MTKNNTKVKGDATEGAVLAELLRLRLPVLIPFGDNQRYDLVVDSGGRFVRVQCKTGCLRNGCVLFRACSSNRKGVKSAYHGHADVFGVYCEALDTVYFVKVDEVGVSTTSLRVEKALNGQESGRRAADYEAWPYHEP